MSQTIVPSLYVKSKGESTVKLTLRLTTAQQKVVVRFTGGCAKMSAQDAEGLYELFVESFVGMRGAILFGGTRMLRRDNPSEVIPGITEVAHRIRKANPGSISLGVVPRTSEMSITEHGLIVEDDGVSDHLTIVHPEQDICLIVQLNADGEEVWDAEWQECAHLIEELREFAGFSQSLLVCYNGGSVTERELLAHASRGWPVLLIEGSGRTTDKYAGDEAFLATYPNVRVAEKSVDSIRSQLIQSGVLPPDKLRLIHPGVAS